MKLSFCAVIAGIQIAAALGALALGQPAIAAALGVFAMVQVISVIGQQCGPTGSCDSRVVAPDAPGRRVSEGR